MAELLAIFYGLQIAGEKNLQALEINTDSEEAITMITNGHLTYNKMIFGCRLHMQQWGAPVLRNVCREQKRVAYVLARNAFFEPRFLAVPPVYDTSGTTSARIFLFVIFTIMASCWLHYHQIMHPQTNHVASYNLIHISCILLHKV